MIRKNTAYSLALWVALVACYLTLESRQDPVTPKKITSKQYSNNSALQCNSISLQVEACAKPLLDIIEGTIQKWPKTDQEAEDYCGNFGGSEKCIRDTGRRCAKGLERTIVSTVSSSIQRVRKKECVKGKYGPLVKTYDCLEKNSAAVRDMVKLSSKKLQVIDSQMKNPDQKTTAVCCTIFEIENNLRGILAPTCPAEAEIVISLYRGVLQDVLDLICRAPKCNDIFKGFKNSKEAPAGGIISLILNIVFSLDAESQ